MTTVSPAWGGEFEDGQRGPAGADHRHGLIGIQCFRDLVDTLQRGEREFGVAAAGQAKVSDHEAAQPPLGHAGPDLVDHAGDLAARRHRQRGHGPRPGLTPADDRVEQVHPG
jgi:hypothetical protein